MARAVRMAENTGIGSLLTDSCIYPTDDRATPAKRESEALECGGECRDKRGKRQNKKAQRAPK